MELEIYVCIITLSFFPSSDMVTGTMVISLTNPIQNADFEVLVKGNVTTSWGAADFYVQEKLTPAKRE